MDVAVRSTKWIIELYADQDLNYHKKFSPDSEWLSLNIMSNWYSMCGKDTVQEVYGDTYDAGLPCG